MRQLPLAIGPGDSATFASFLATDTNRMVLSTLRQLSADVEYSLSYVHGPVGSGRTHLLQAVCHHLAGEVALAQYLPLAELRHYRPSEICAQLEEHDVVCLDDLSLVAANAEWELALFNFINRKILTGGTVVIGASRPASAAGFLLPDLISRLQQGLVMGLPEPSDAEKVEILVWRGHQRGMIIPTRVADFILTHTSRNLHELMRLLDEIDAQSLSQQRRVTVPFIRDLIQNRQHSDG